MSQQPNRTPHESPARIRTEEFSHRVRGLDEHGFYVSTADGVVAMSVEHEAESKAGIKELQVPAGTFTTVAIEPLAAAPHAGGVLSFSTRWVADGIGTIRQGGVVSRNLASYAVVLAVEPATWGGIKWRTGIGRRGER